MLRESTCPGAKLAMRKQRLSRFERHDLPSTRYSLLSRLQDWQDQESWKDFFDSYWRLIYGLAFKAGLSEAEAEDVVQEVVISVAKHIQKFERNRELGSFKGWLRNIIRWRIADQMAKRLPVLQPEAGTNCRGSMNDGGEMSPIHDFCATELEAAWEEEWRENLFKAALHKVKQRVNEEHYLIFDLYVLRGWPVLKVARKVGVNVTQVYLAKHRIARLIRKEIEVIENRSV
jgi:RNA polymerase sigma-70 factor (ECF subfamily)